MVYTTSQQFSKETEQMMGKNNPDYNEFKLDKERENRKFFERRDKERRNAMIKKFENQILTCPTCGINVRYFSISGHKRSKKCQKNKIDY